MNRIVENVLVTRETTPGHITWETLVVLEPALIDLLIEARSISVGSDYCCRHDLYAFDDISTGRRSFKARIGKLVGWGSRHVNPLLHSSIAWEMATSTILSALPRCRNCTCMCVNEDSILCYTGEAGECGEPVKW